MIAPLLAGMAVAASSAAGKVVLSPSLGVGPGTSVAQALAKPWAAPVEAPLLKGGRRTLRSCNDFLAVSKGISDEIGDREAQVLLAQAVRCQALKAVRDHGPATRSFVSGFKLDAAGWRISPPAFDFAESPDALQEEQAVARRGGSAADVEKVVLTPRDAFRSTVRGDGWSGEFEILVRGLDVNGDGDEDLIVTCNASPDHGTLRSLVYMVVTRTKPSGALRLVDGFPRPALGLPPK